VTVSEFSPRPEGLAAPKQAHAKPIRVLHVITRMILGGAQENTLLSCSLIDRAGFPSEILCGPETGAEGSLHDDCRLSSVTLHLEPALRRSVHPWHDFIALLRLTHFIRRGHYDVVHTHSSKAGVLGRVAARLAGAPVVVHTVHGWPFSQEESPVHRTVWVNLERFCARLADAIVVVGSADQEKGLELGIGRPDQYHLIRSGIDVEYYRGAGIDRGQVRSRLGLPRDAFVVGSVGRLSRQKAPLDLLGAFEPVARARPDAHMVIVGDGPDRPAVEAAVRNSRLDGRIHLAGLRRDVPALMCAFDVFALASHWEGLPRVLPQAMAAGLPIVASRANGVPDAVVNGENGWLVDVGDVAGLSRRLLELSQDPSRARRMGERGRERAEEFSARRMVDQLTVLYRRLVLWKEAPASKTEEHELADPPARVA
jgi:glycosyltransferase involved in cell wall biosynthesis